MASLVMHWPEYEMQSAPWTKTSSSASVCARMAAMSSSDSSRARMMRDAPTERASSTPAASVHVICVDAWMGSSGATARTRRAAHRRLDLERVDLGLLGLRRGLRLGSGRRAALAALLALPLAKGEHARLDLDDRDLLVVLLDRRREPVAHGHLRRLADMRKEVLSYRELGDFLVMQRLAH